jgi:hypothetical protein
MVKLPTTVSDDAFETGRLMLHFRVRNRTWRLSRSRQDSVRKIAEIETEITWSMSMDMLSLSWSLGNCRCRALNTTVDVDSASFSLYSMFLCWTGSGFFSKKNYLDTQAAADRAFFSCKESGEIDGM